MNEEEYQHVKKSIRKVLRKHPNGQVVLFGANKRMQQIANMLREEGRNPDSIVDNDEKKQHSLCSGITVYSPEEALSPCRPDTMIFTCSAFSAEMTEQAIRLGYKKSQICDLYDILRNETETFRISSVMRGARLYKELKKKYGESTSIILAPYTGTGNIYLIGTFLSDFLKAHDIKDYVLVTVSKACSNIASIFEIEKIEQISSDESRALCNAYMFAPELFSAYIMGDVVLYTNHIQYLRGYKNLNFADINRISEFDLGDDCKPEIPKPTENEVTIKFITGNSIDENTILISPYSNTLPALQPKAWSQLVYQLNQKGYRVLTNSSGTSEPAIEGTEVVSFPLNQAIQVLNHMGGFIGVRSGFCDIASAAHCKKIILYDETKAFYSGTPLNYYSLNSIGLCDDAYEFAYKNDDKNITELIDKIVGIITAKQENQIREMRK